MSTVIHIRRNKKLFVTLLLLPVALLCCKSLPPTVTTTDNNKKVTKPHTVTLVPDSTDVVIAQTHWAGTSLPNLNQGYAIFSDKCTDCHEAKMPQDFSIDEWNAILPKMGRKAHLDSIQYKMVYRYILAKRENILAARK